MKGIIFNIAEQYLTDTYGEDRCDDILASCAFITQEPFVGPGTYPDEDLVEILVKAAAATGTTVPVLLRNLGDYMFAGLAARHPVFLQGFDHPKPFLMTVDSIIHVEVKKLYRDAYLPTFQYAEPSPDALTITYYSERKLYPLMEGLINGTSRHFGVPIRQSHTVYEKDGLEFCDFHLTFPHEHGAGTL